VRLRFILPMLYLAFAAYAWVDFARLPPDGLANLGLLLVTLPVTLAGLLLTSLAGAESFVLLPSGHGYLLDHLIYYVPAVVVTAFPLWGVGRAIDRWRASPRGE
jgi:hypothetical protein